MRMRSLERRQKEVKKRHGPQRLLLIVECENTQTSDLPTTAHILEFLDGLPSVLLPPESLNDADRLRSRDLVVWDIPPLTPRF